MKFESLRPKPYPQPLTEQCSHKITPKPQWTGKDGYWSNVRQSRSNEKGFDIDRCQKFASVKLDGKPYCRAHAGQLLLEELEGEQ